MKGRQRAAGNSWLSRIVRRLRRRAHFSISALFFLVLAIGLTGIGMPTARALLLAFDMAAAVFLTATIYTFTHSKTSSMRSRARKQDESYWGFLLGNVAVAIVALVALALELHASKTGGALEIILAGCTLLLAWLFMNTIFALHYAHEFYGDAGEKASGLQFPGTRQPDYWDFIYFAFVIGMTFQVSDVQISEHDIRHVVLVHAIVAFFFNVIIIALSVNLIAGKA